MPVNRNLSFIILLSLSLMFVLVFFNIYFFTRLKKIPTQGLCKDCNIVIIDIDVLRADAIDCIDAYDRTPNICEFEKRSTVFKQNVAESDMTLPSMVSFETSLYPSSHGVWHELYPTSNDSYKYIGELLQEKGYSTTYMGLYKYHNKVTVRGFQKTIELPSVFDNGFNPVEIVSELKSTGSPYLLYLYIADLHFPYLPLGVGVLENPIKAPKGLPRTFEDYQEDFSDYLVKNIHSVFRPQAFTDNPELFSDIRKNKYRILWEYTFWAADREQTARYLFDIWKPKEDAFLRYIDKSNPEHVQYLKNNYLSILHLIDKRLAGFLNFISHGENAKNTIVILRTDHGEEFLEHGNWEHGNNLYQELIHTPLVINVPGVKPSEINSLTEDIDLLPTLYDIMGLEIPRQFQGASLLPMMKERPSKVPDYQVTQKGEDIYISSFRKNDMKVIMKQGTPTELYDLSKDPGEKINLIGPGLAAARVLFQEYASVIEPLPKYGLKTSPIPTWVDEKKKQRLKNEGYF